MARTWVLGAVAALALIGAAVAAADGCSGIDQCERCTLRRVGVGAHAERTTVCIRCAGGHVLSPSKLICYPLDDSSLPRFHTPAAADAAPTAADANTAQAAAAAAAAAESTPPVSPAPLAGGPANQSAEDGSRVDLPSPPQDITVSASGPSAAAAAAGGVGAAYSSYCVDWATKSWCDSAKAKGYCDPNWYISDNKGYDHYIASFYCPKTCGRCGCKDILSVKDKTNCATLKQQGKCAAGKTPVGDRRQTIGAFWCPATCGEPCAVPAREWTTGATTGQIFFSGSAYYIYRNSMALTSHIYDALEVSHGPHYYAQGVLSNAYTSAMTYAQLPSFNAKYRRVPCIAFNVIGTGSVDVGVENYGQGWFPFFYSWTADLDHIKFKYPDSRVKPYANAHADAVKVLISVDVYVTSGFPKFDAVSGFFRFYNAAGKGVGDHTLDFVLPAGQMFSTYLVNGRPTVRFTRFMSWLPVLPQPGQSSMISLERPDADKADGSSMSSASFTSLLLYDAVDKRYKPWDGSRLEFVWSSETANIKSLSISPSGAPTTDTFTCTSQFWYI